MKKSPKKLKDATKTEISFAIQLEKGKLKAVDKDNRLIFTYLPTSINYDFPFLVNASFLTDAGRQHLHQDVFWNNWIFKQIPLHFFAWIAELAHKNSKYNKQFLAIIPQKLIGHTSLQNSFNEGFVYATNTIPFVPNLNGDLLKVSETIFDSTNISSHIDKQIIINYINAKTKKNLSVFSFVPYIESIKTLSNLGMETIEIVNLEDFFASDIFAKEHKLDENFKLISFLYEQAEKSKNKDGVSVWNEKLKNMSFIFDENKKLKSPKYVYFPTLNFSEEFTNDIQIIHQTIMNEITQNSKIKNWLEFLGVKEPTDISFIEKTIIAQIDTFITKNNAIKVGKLLFNAYRKGLLQEYHFEKMNTSIKVLTKGNSLLSTTKTFLSDFYEPDISIENFCKTDIFVSEKYYENKDLKSEWKSFFIKIGVSEDFKILTFNYIGENSLSDLGVDISYFRQGVQSAKSQNNYNGFPINGINSFQKLSLLEATDNYRFSKLFWERIFKNFKPQNFDLYSTLDMGYWNGYCKIENYNKWVFKNSYIIPTTQRTCLKASQVFSNTIPQITEIAGDYLPIFDYGGIVSPDWVELLQFKTFLKYTDYLDILEGIADDSFSKDKQKENQKRLKLVYEKLSYLIPSLHDSEREKIKNWGKNNKILAKNGKDFYFPKELSIVTVEGFNADTLAYANERNSAVLDLMRLLGVSVIDKVLPIMSNNMVEIGNLKNKLLEIAPLLALIVVGNSKNQEDWEKEFRKIKNKLQQIQFFRTSEIYLSYGNETDKQRRSTWAENNKFYYVGDWNSARVLDGLIEPLCKFLQLLNAERFLNVLLLENFASGSSYLEEKGYDISLIPDELLNPKEPETVINQGNTPYNVESESLGKLGEQFVYEELKRIYTKKYGQPIEETKTGFKIGSKLEVFWRNISENTTANHDFKVVELGKEIYIDSKATPYAKNVEKVALYISGNELELMETAEKYLIARVFNVTTNPEMELIKLQISGLSA